MHVERGYVYTTDLQCPQNEQEFEKIDRQRASCMIWSLLYSWWQVTYCDLAALIPWISATIQSVVNAEIAVTPETWCSYFGGNTKSKNNGWSFSVLAVEVALLDALLLIVRCGIILPLGAANSQYLSSGICCRGDLWHDESDRDTVWVHGNWGSWGTIGWMSVLA